jgi:molybdopterin-containing oxidoreductase family membrane subunit
MFIGSLGLFFTLFFLFAKFLPVIAAAEVKSIYKTSSEEEIAKTAAKEGLDLREAHAHTKGAH